MRRFLIKCSYTVFPLLLLVYLSAFRVEKVLPGQMVGDLSMLSYWSVDQDYLVRMAVAEPDTLRVPDFDELLGKDSSMFGAKASLSSTCTGESPFSTSQPEACSRQFDIVTIGDSFSALRRRGYQNSLQRLSGLTVLNISRPEGEWNVLTTVMGLLNAGYLQQLQPRIVVVECVERYFQGYVGNYSRNARFQLSDFLPVAPPVQQDKYRPDVLSDVLAYMKYHLLPLSQRPVRTVALDNVYFSDSRQGNELHFYYEDLNSLAPPNQQQMIDALQSLKARFDSLNIELVLLIACDKYDAYYPHIIDNPYTENLSLTNFPFLDTSSWIVNTKPLLRRAIDSGRQDVYLLNDSHWSAMGSEMVATELNRRIKETLQGDSGGATCKNEETWHPFVCN